MKTLAEKVMNDFSRIKVKKTIVKVPRLRIRNLQSKKPKNESQNKGSKIPVSSLISILIKTAIENAKRELKEKPVENGKSYKLIKEGKKLISPGGYGSVSKRYGSVHTSYVDYGKLFSYLGSFRAKQPYEGMAEHAGVLNKSAESRSFTLVDRETMDKGKFYIRYVNSKAPIDKTSLVPIAGMSSAEWEEFKWFMRLDTPLYLLKISTS